MFPCTPLGVSIRIGCNDGVPAATEGVLAQSVNGIPPSLFGARVGTGVAGLGGAGRRLGGLFDGDATIWFLRGLPCRSCCGRGAGGSCCGAKTGDSFLRGTDGGEGMIVGEEGAGWGMWSLIFWRGCCWDGGGAGGCCD